MKLGDAYIQIRARTGLLHKDISIGQALVSGMLGGIAADASAAGLKIGAGLMRGLNASLPAIRAAGGAAVAGLQKSLDGFAKATAPLTARMGASLERSFPRATEASRQAARAIQSQFAGLQRSAAQFMATMARIRLPAFPRVPRLDLSQLMAGVTRARSLLATLGRGVTAPIRLGLSGLQAEVSRARGMLGSLLPRGGGELFGGIAGVAGGMLAATGITSLFSAVKSLTGAMIDGNAELERYQTSLEVMLGSAERAANFIGEVKAMAASTPFEVPGLISAAQQLIGVGVAADRTLPMLNKLGDAAAASTEGLAALPRLITPITQMLGAGRINTQDMMQIANLGIPAWKILADKIGVSQAELREMAAQGKLGMQEIGLLVDGLGEKYAGLMAKQSKTWGGLMSNMRDTFAQTIQRISAPLFELAKVQLGNLLNFTGSERFAAIVESITAGAQRAADFLRTAFESPIGQAILKFTALAGVTTAVVGGMVALKAAAATALAFLTPIAVPIAAITAGVAALGVAIREALNSPAGEQLRATFGEIRDLVVEIAGNLWNLLGQAVAFITSAWRRMTGTIGASTGSMFQSVLNWIRNVLDNVTILTANFRLTWDYIKAYTVLKLNEMRDAAKNVVNFMLATASGLWDGLVAGIAAVKDYFVSAFEEMRNLFQAVWAGIQAAWNEGFTGDPLAAFNEAFNGALMSQADALVPNIGKAVADGFKHGFDGVRGKDFVSDQTREAREAVDEIWDKMEAERNKQRLQRNLEIQEAAPAGAIAGKMETTPAGGETETPRAMTEAAKPAASFSGIEEFARGIQQDLSKRHEKKMEDLAEQTVKGIDKLNKGVKILNPISPQPALFGK